MRSHLTYKMLLDEKNYGPAFKWVSWLIALSEHLSGHTALRTL